MVNRRQYLKKKGKLLPAKVTVGSSRLVQLFLYNLDTEYNLSLSFQYCDDKEESRESAH